MRLRWTRTALSDLASIRAYIARDDVSAAKRMAERLISAADLLERYPQAGRSTPARPERELAVSGTPYILVYRVAARRIDILAVLHGARNRRK